MFFVGKSWAEDEEIIALMARIAENVSFAIENFERAGEKARADAQKERLGRMLAALSATNEAIVRATSRTELFELVCEAAAKGGRSTRPAFSWPDRQRLYRYGGRGGADGHNMRRVKVSTNADHPEGRGLCGNAFRSRQACIANNLRADPRGSAFPPVHSQRRRNVGRGVPADGFRPGGRRDVFHLLGDRYVHARISPNCCSGSTDNVSFAIATFDRADEKARTENQKERLTRMFASLSATNEAIMRAKSRDELFDMVCEAAGERRPVHLGHHRIGRLPAATCSGSSPPRARRPRRRGTSGCRWMKPVPRAAGSAERRSEPGGRVSPMIM
jgi:hypothetical protein